MIRLDVAILVLSTVGFVGCSVGSEPDVCRNHRVVHAEHADSVGLLTIVLADDGTLQKDLKLPDGSVMQDPDNSLIGLTFEDDGRLRQIDVRLFELLPDLHEVEVTMTTPATSKHFAISRDCESPIFGLEQAPDEDT